jgi:hypothetical protein
MNAHLIGNSGQVTIATIASYPRQPRTVTHAGKLYAVNDPGFAFFGGIDVGEYMEYRETIPVAI